MAPPSVAGAPRAVLFDVFGTLFDVYSVGRRLESLFPGHGERASQLWRDKQIEYTHLCSMADRYRPFSELTRCALHFTCTRLGLPLTPTIEQTLMDEYRRLAPFAENRAVLQTLRARGIRAGVLSNGEPPLLDSVIAHAGFGAWLDPVLSAHSVQRFKTDDAVYALGPQALGLPARQILFVSSNGWDAIGATWYGYTTLWINRAGAPLDVLGTEPTRTGSNLRDVLDFFAEPAEHPPPV
ncbi:MAG: haloacid dehalogenase type II [Ideonella sp.]|nr:haloacid dehalogenase type II [Ideonella sp.]MCC7455900.1 haloacid dehalogenase type II [Nitrospira sp.]